MTTPTLPGRKKALALLGRPDSERDGLPCRCEAWSWAGTQSAPAVVLGAFRRNKRLYYRVKLLGPIGPLPAGAEASPPASCVSFGAVAEG